MFPDLARFPAQSGKPGCSVLLLQSGNTGEGGFIKRDALTNQDGCAVPVLQYGPLPLLDALLPAGVVVERVVGQRGRRVALRPKETRVSPGRGTANTSTHTHTHTHTRVQIVLLGKLLKVLHDDVDIPKDVIFFPVISCDKQTSFFYNCDKLPKWETETEKKRGNRQVSVNWLLIGR